MVATTAETPLSFARIPLSSWGFAIRIWLATILALFVSFWLQLEAPTTAALTVGVLAEPTRGQALDKAAFRLFATVIGVTVSLAIAGLFPQSRDLMLAAFAVWLGVCAFAAKLLDGDRAYAAVLSGYTVALIAIQQIDNPHHVFESGMARGAAIAIGIVSIAVVNTLMSAPNRQPWLMTQLVSVHRRVRAYASATLRGETGNTATFVELLREIVALRPEIASIAAESSSGSARSAAARSVAVALIAQLQAARTAPGSETSAWMTKETFRRDREVREDLAALRSASWPSRTWRAPLYRSYRIAAESGARAALWFAMASAIYVWAGWPAASVSLSFVALIAALGAATPNPRAFTALALVGTPIAAVMTGILEFIVLNGADSFPVLAIGLAPFTLGAALLITSRNILWSGLGRVNLQFVMLIMAPSNPQTYNPQAFLFTSLFIIVAASLLLAAQMLMPPVSDDKRRILLLKEARDDLADRSFKSREAPEEATFRDASRIAQVLPIESAEDGERLTQMLSCFDQSAMLRMCGSELTRLDGGPLAPLAHQARKALVIRDTAALRDVARLLLESSSHIDSVEADIAACLASTSEILDRHKKFDLQEAT